MVRSDPGHTFHFIPVVPLLALKIRKDLSEIASWLGPTKKGMGLFGHLVQSGFEQKNVSAGVWFRKCWSDNSDESDDDSDDIFDESSDNEHLFFIVIMARTSVGRRGRGGCGLSDHATARGCGQKSSRTNTSGTRYETNASIFSDTWVQEPEGKDEPNTDAAYNGALVDKYGLDPANHPIYESIMMTYGNSVPEMIRKLECLGGVPCQIHRLLKIREWVVPPLIDLIKLIFEFVMLKNYLDSVHGELKEETKVELKEDKENVRRINACGINSR
ncbi:hypothetical protein Tco_0947951 [Tanacetum coccineum]